jgi:hypothetical protein
VKQLLAPTGTALERLAAGGACVYVSYSPGDTAWHRGPSYGRLTPRVNPDDTVTLYDALAGTPGCAAWSPPTTRGWPATR